MKPKNRIHYKNPTIIEAVVEIRFSSLIDNVKIEKPLGSKYRCEKEELMVYTAALNPAGMSLHHSKPGQVRLKFIIKDQVSAQVYPDRFSFHWLGKYPGWDVFQLEFSNFWKELSKVLPNIKGKQIGIRFINILEQKTTKQKVGYWLKVSSNFPKSILSVKNDYFYRSKWPLKPGKLAQVFIAEGELKKEHFKPLIFDIDVIQNFEEPIEVDSSLSKITFSLHDEVIKIFESSISNHYKKILNRS